LYIYAQTITVHTIKCIIVEDNKNDYKLLLHYIDQYSFLDCKGYFENALTASEYLRTHPVDLLFMDIDMPIMSGMDFFKQLKNPPTCIFVTAHSEYAWEGFEAQAFDFILKPVKENRLAQSIQRLQEFLEIQKRADLYDATIEEKTITIKEGGTSYIVQLNDILYLEALKDYTKIVTAQKKYLTLSKLKHCVDKLPEDQFKRIHRSYAIALAKITSKDNNDVVVNNIKIPIGKTFKTQLNF
jgi:DNA-binding LytR/AlgR family response regulator